MPQPPFSGRPILSEPRYRNCTVSARYTAKCGNGITKQARGAHPVRGKGRAHPPKKTEGYEPSFSLIRADSRHAVKGDSYVRRTFPTAPSQPRTIQEAR